MNASEFNKLADLHGLKTKGRAGAKLVKVDGLSAYAAAKQIGVPDSTVTRALAKIERGVCKCCGQPLRDAD